MENFFKALEAIGEVAKSLKDEADRNANQGRLRQAEGTYGSQFDRTQGSGPVFTGETFGERFTRNYSASSEYASGSPSSFSRRTSDSGFSDEAYGSQVPRPSAPVFAADSITKQLARTPSVSSGYASGSSSNSTRRNSDASIDDEMLQNEISTLTRNHAAAAASPRGQPSDPSLNPAGALLGALAIGALGVGAYYLLGKKKVLVETFSRCEQILEKVKKDAQEHPIIGLDCQWVSWGKNRSRVALLQLSSYNGNIALIQLQKIGRIPSDLRDLLADRNIIKVGIETLQDAIHLKQDYGLTVKGTFDLRFLARDTGHHSGGLKRLAKEILNIDIGRDVEIMASDWEQDPLSDEQVTYAEAAVKASFDIFQKLIHELYWFAVVERALEYVKPMLDTKFR